MQRCMPLRLSARKPHRMSLYATSLFRREGSAVRVGRTVDLFEMYLYGLYGRRKQRAHNANMQSSLMLYGHRSTLKSNEQKGDTRKTTDYIFL